MLTGASDLPLLFLHPGCFWMAYQSFLYALFIHSIRTFKYYISYHTTFLPLDHTYYSDGALLDRLKLGAARQQPFGVLLYFSGVDYFFVGM